MDRRRYLRRASARRYLTANVPLHRPLYDLPRRVLRPVAFTRPTLAEWSDRRRWDPRGWKTAGVVGSRGARVLELASARSSFRLRDVFRFHAPLRVAVCIRRQARKEVLFAKRRLRAGGSRKMNEFSSVSCKR